MNVRTQISDYLAAQPERKRGDMETNGSNRYAILYWIQTAIKPETRARRIAEFIAMLERRKTLHP